MEHGPKAGALTTHRDQLPSSSQYELLVRIASGGMATVYVGRRHGVAGFSREVAIKRAHAHLLEDPAFAKQLVAEAKIAARLHHPNVVAVQAVEVLEGEILLIMDYVEGASLAELAPIALAGRPQGVLPPGVVVRILLDACAGLHAAHTAIDDEGKPLGLVHRDVSPQNILVGVDGIARVSDFGIAKSTRVDTHNRTNTGTLKGKVAYMAPEYVESGALDVRSDVFALGVVAWESLTGHRLFKGTTEIETLRQVLATQVPTPSTVAPSLGAALDKVLLRALARDPRDRFPSTLAFGDALEDAARKAGFVASGAVVGDAVRAVAGAALAKRRALIRGQAHAPPSEGSMRVVGRGDATDTLDIDGAPAAATEVVATPSESRTPDAASATLGSISSPATEKPARRSAFVVASGAALAVAVVAAGTWFARGRNAPVVAPATAVVPAAEAPPVASMTTERAPAASSDLATSPPATLSAPPTASASATAFASPSATQPRGSTPASGRRSHPAARPATSVDRAPPNPYADHH